MLCLAVSGCQDKPSVPAKVEETKAIPDKAPVVTVTQRDAERAFDEQKAEIARKESFGSEYLARNDEEGPLIGDINHDGKDDAVVAYLIRDDSQHAYYSLYAVFLHDGQGLRYQSSFDRGLPGVDTWHGGGGERYPGYITFRSIKNGAVQAEERSEDKQKRVLKENYYFYLDKLISAFEVDYLKSDRRGFLDFNGEALPLADVRKHFGSQGKVSTEIVDCPSYSDGSDAKYYKFGTATFEVWQGKAGFFYTMGIPKNVRIVLRGLVVTADMTEQEFKNKTKRDPRFTIVHHDSPDPDIPGTRYIVAQQATDDVSWAFTFNHGKLLYASYYASGC